MIGCAVDPCCAVDEDEFDTHECLRLFAADRLGAPDYTPNDARTKELSREEFDAWFFKALTRQGWPIYKYGRGKAVRRCLRLEDGALTWGSKKEGGQRILLDNVIEIIRDSASDAPPGTNPDAMLCLLVADGTGLKILCYSVTDAIILTFGFKGLINAFKHVPVTRKPASQVAQ